MRITLRLSNNGSLTIPLFEIDKINELPEFGGLYCYYKLQFDINNPNIFVPLYFGKTHNLRERFNSHRTDDIWVDEATYWGFIRIDSEEERTEIEQDVLTNNNFQHNIQHN